MLKSRFYATISFVLLVALQLMVFLGNEWFSRPALREVSQALDSQTSPASNEPYVNPAPINWTARVDRKRQWLDQILSSLPQDAIHEPFRKNTKKARICGTMAKALAHSQVIHSLPGIHVNISSQHRHAIVIPYRDRAYHLQQFLEYMSSYLKFHYQRDKSKSGHTFAMYIIEQDDDELFNRALLMNAGLDHVSPDTECVIQHDVDMVPAFFARVPYHKCSRPQHLAARAESKDFTTLYETHLGVVTSMHQQHWASINGMDNQMQGWGGEDDDLYVRLAFLGLVNCTKHPHGAPFRPSNDEGNVFMAIAENGGHHTRSPFKNRTHRVNHERSIKYRETGLSPSVASSGGWKQTKYHVSRRSTWDLSTTEALHGFAEIHHIKVKVDKSSLEMCFWKCSRRMRPMGRLTPE